jgi:hypothetical protein
VVPIRTATTATATGFRATKPQDRRVGWPHRR